MIGMWKQPCWQCRKVTLHRHSRPLRLRQCREQQQSIAMVTGRLCGRGTPTVSLAQIWTAWEWEWLLKSRQLCWRQCLVDSTMGQNTMLLPFKPCTRAAQSTNEWLITRSRDTLPKPCKPLTQCTWHRSSNDSPLIMMLTAMNSSRWPKPSRRHTENRVSQKRGTGPTLQEQRGSLRSTLTHHRRPHHLGHHPAPEFVQEFQMVALPDQYGLDLVAAPVLRGHLYHNKARPTTEDK
mmetsp:Transcript_43285/g.101839  ORF Transcript_43285/g.101839 Transcript_43285/m.101839 type:complete len:236 (-) Transcript_43285:547-1254(-)